MDGYELIEIELDGREDETFSDLIEAPSNMGMFSQTETQAWIRVEAVCYKPGRVSSGDEQYNNNNISTYRFCHTCRSKYFGSYDEESCPFCHPVRIIRNRKMEQNSRSTAGSMSLPTEFSLRPPRGDEENLRIFTEVLLEKGTVFGPLEGPRVPVVELDLSVDLQYAWLCGTGKDITSQEFILTRDTKACNWLQFLSVGNSDLEPNVSILLRENNIYFMAEKSILSNCEIVLYSRDPRPYIDRLIRGGSVCKRCCLYFPDDRTCGFHRLFWHNIKRTSAACDMCGAFFLCGLSIAKHGELEHDVHEWTCKIKCCNRHFTKIDDYPEHLVSVHGGKKQIYPCCRSGNIYAHHLSYRNELRRMKDILPTEKGVTAGSLSRELLKTVQCPHCEVRVCRQSILERHINYVHNKVKNLVCDTCGKGFRDASNYKVHMLSHSGVKPFVCSIRDCGAAYTTKQCLQVHYRRAHGFTDMNMPNISRIVPFTIEAHANSLV